MILSLAASSPEGAERIPGFGIVSGVVYSPWIPLRFIQATLATHFLFLSLRRRPA